MCSLHILALLVEDEVSRARLLWKRIPAALKTEPGELCRAWAVAKALGQCDYGAAHPLLLLEWSPTLRPAVEHLSAQVRRRRLKALSTAYEKVHIDTLMTQCGMTEAEVEAECQYHKWNFDPLTRMVQLS
ncbi:unnamed protein product, partial [Ectocarpus fasciculatus]